MDVLRFRILPVLVLMICSLLLLVTGLRQDGVTDRNGRSSRSSADQGEVQTATSSHSPARVGNVEEVTSCFTQRLLAGGRCNNERQVCPHKRLRGYLLCNQQRWVEMQCPPGTLYDYRRTLCVDPTVAGPIPVYIRNLLRHVYVEAQPCQVGMMRPSNTDSYSYQVCIHNSTSNSVWIRRSCPDGTMYSDVTSNCGQHVPKTDDGDQHLDYSNAYYDQGEVRDSADNEYHAEAEDNTVPDWQYVQEREGSDDDAKAAEADEEVKDLEQQYIVEAVNKYIPEAAVYISGIENEQQQNEKLARLLERTDPGQRRGYVGSNRKQSNEEQQVAPDVEQSRARSVVIVGMDELFHILRRSYGTHGIRRRGPQGREISNGDSPQQVAEGDLFVGADDNVEYYLRDTL